MSVITVILGREPHREGLFSVTVVTVDGLPSKGSSRSNRMDVALELTTPNQHCA
jgi:hypothetical protein